MSLLDVKNLSLCTPAGRVLIRNLSFEVNENEILWIRGPNGIGKSTLLKHLVKTFKRQKAIGYLPQIENTETHLPLTIRDVLTISLPPWEKHPMESFLQFQLLKQEELAHAWNHASGGERKKTLITRLLVQNRKILILDEPFNHLDAHTRKQTMTALSQWVKAPNEARAIVLVSHEFDMGEDLANLNPKQIWLGGA